MCRIYPRQVLRALVISLILIIVVFITTPVRVPLPRSVPCPDVSDLLLKIQELRAGTSSKGNDLLDKANIAALGRMGINISMLAGPLGQHLLEMNDKSTPPTPKPTEYANELLSPNELLDPQLAPNNVFYVWCGRRWFEFQHYLSVKSVIRELRPDNILFYFDFEPVVDSWTYNTWFMELKQEYPFFKPYFLNDNDAKKACEGFAKPRLEFIYERLTYSGGMYISEYTILSHFPLKYRKLTMVHALNLSDLTGFLMTKRGYPGDRSLNDILGDPQLETKDFFCSSAERYIQSHHKPLCVNPNAFFPKEIWELNNSFGKLVRRVFYGNPDIQLPQQNFDELIPNIAHIVWIGGGEMDFLFYLGVISLIYVAEVDMVYIHGDLPPFGPYWNRIRHHPQLRLVYRQVPLSVYSNKVEVLSHITDIWRVDFMIRYGGIYVDTDTAFVRKLDKDIRAYDAVGTYDWTYWNHPFPDTINFGVAIGKKNAKFWQLFQESMRWFMDEDWSWNGLRQPYRIKERHPELIKIDPRLQVTCFKSLCHPTWWPNYHNESIHHQNSNSITNWREQIYAFHWTLPTPFELKNEVNLFESNTMFSDIGKYILQKAGQLETFKLSADLMRKTRTQSNQKKV